MADLAKSVLGSLIDDGVVVPESQLALAAQDLEAWLSLLLAPQPHLTAIENAENEAMAQRVLLRIYAEVVGRCSEVLATWSARPEWLTTFIGHLVSDHAGKSALVTLNYDTLLEAAIAPQWCQGHHCHLSDLDPVSVPLWQNSPGGLAAAGRRRRDRVTLFKLHGSVHWRWAGPTDEAGDTVCQLPLRDQDGLVEGGDGHPQPPDPAHFYEVERRVPFIVPPAAGKTTYFNNGFTRGLWAAARKRLVEADVLYCLGYSVPETDTTMRALLLEAALGKPVVVVDTDERVQHRYEMVLPSSPTGIIYIGGDDPIATFVGQLRGR